MPAGALVAQALAKQAIDRGLTTSLADGLRHRAATCSSRSFRTDDSQIGVKSFLEHGPGKADVHRHLTAPHGKVHEVCRIRRIPFVVLVEAPDDR